MADEQGKLDPELFGEIATVNRDITQTPFAGLLSPNDDTLLTRGAGKSYKIYDEIERDCHAYAVLTKRKIAVVSREYVVIPASEEPRDVEAADLVKAQLTDLDFDESCKDLLDATLKGFAVGEAMYERQGNRVLVTEIRARDQRRFKFDTAGNLRLLTREQPFIGRPVPDRKFIVHRFGAKDNNPYGKGLGHLLFWPVWFKRQDITFWLTFADKFGMPTAVGEYPKGATKAEQDKLLAALGKIASDTGIIVPQGMLIKLLEIAKAGATDVYEKLARYLDEQISEAVLGETLTTNIGGKGSLAAGQVHDSVRLELAKADADLLSSTLNRSIVRWIVEFNLPGAKPPTVWRVFPKDLKAQAERDKAIADLGYRPTPEYIQQNYGEGWVPKEPGPSAPSRPVEVSFAEPAADLVDHFAERADAQAADAMEAVVAPVRNLVQSAGSLEEIRDGLLGLYPGMKSAGLGTLMEYALTASHLGGRYEASRGD